MVIYLKKVTGSILVGFGVLAEVINAWLSHMFWAFGNIAKGVNSEFNAPARYGEVLTYPFNQLNIFTGTQILIWAIILLGLGLILLGLIEDKKVSE